VSTAPPPPDRADYDDVEDYVEEAVEHVSDRADDVARHAEAAEAAADRADEAAATVDDSASSAAVAEQIDDSTDLVVDTAPYVAPARPEPSPSLLRHSPFKIGFVGAFGALVAVFLRQQLLSISSVLVLLVLAMFLAIGLNPTV
jgi:hypothetical protein